MLHLSTDISFSRETLTFEFHILLLLCQHLFDITGDCVNHGPASLREFLVPPWTANIYFIEWCLNVKLILLPIRSDSVLYISFFHLPILFGVEVVLLFGLTGSCCFEKHLAWQWPLESNTVYTSEDATNYAFVSSFWPLSRDMFFSYFFRLFRKRKSGAY